MSKDCSMSILYQLKSFKKPIVYSSILGIDGTIMLRRKPPAHTLVYKDCKMFWKPMLYGLIRLNNS